MEFLPSSSFVIKNLENHFVEWGKVFVDRAYTHSQAFEINVRKEYRHMYLLNLI